MKKLLPLIIALFVSTNLLSQIPQSFKYQAVLRDARGNIKANTATNIVIGIIPGSATGTAVYSETHNTTTDGYGLINLEIGKGAVTVGSFSGIDWGTNTYFVKVTVDGVDMGASQLLSVPYALYAKASGGYTESDPVFTAWNKTTGISISASQVGDFQSSVTNNPAVLLNTAKNGYPTADANKLAAIKGTNTGDQDLSGLATTTSVTTGLATKVDKVTGKGLSTNDYTTAEQTKVSNLSGTNTGDQDLSGLATTTSVTTGLATKVDKVAGKGLSTNDYSTAEKTKLAAISGTNTGDNATNTQYSGLDAAKANLSGATFTGAISATNLSGNNTGDQTNITGNAATVTTNANLTGDVTSSGNATTLSNTGVIAATYGSSTQVPVFAVDAKGRVSGVTNTTITGTSPVGSALTSANILVGSATNVAAAVVMSGDVTINNAGATTIGTTKVTNSMLAGSIDLTSKVTGLLPGANGGTGINNSGKTITLGGNLSTAGDLTTTGAFSTTLNATAATSVTLPTTGTLATLGGIESITGLKTFTKDKIAMLGTSTGVTTLSTANNSPTDYIITLQAATGTVALLTDVSSGTASNVSGIVLGTNGGTGIANTGKTITLGGNLSTTGAFATTLNSTATTTVTLPTTGTLATLAGTEALTGKTINGLTPTAIATGFTIAGGTTSKILTVPLDASVSGTNTGDQDLSGKEDKTNKVTSISGASTDLQYPGAKLTYDQLALKVDKVTGKGLSTNDYTTAEQAKLATIAEGAQMNVKPDWNAASGTAAEILNKPTTITTAQANAIIANTAKIGVTPGTAAGQMQYWNGTAWVTIAPGLNGQILKYKNGVPTWSDASINELSIGDIYQGGIIAYFLVPTDPGYSAFIRHGLIAAPSDQSDGALWGCDATLMGCSVALGTGNQNTIAIEAGCPTAGIAADICANLTLGGYSDWYLPSIDELDKLRLNRTAIGGFAINWYWSSSENTKDYGWAQFFTNTLSQSAFTKNANSLRVRAVRSF